MAPFDPGSLKTVMSAEHLMTGGSVSFTVTVNEQVADSPPQGSVAVQVTVVDPTGKKEPDGGEHETIALGQLSLTLGVG